MSRLSQGMRNLRADGQLMQSTPSLMGELLFSGTPTGRRIPWTACSTFKCQRTSFGGGQIGAVKRASGTKSVSLSAASLAFSPWM